VHINRFGCIPKKHQPGKWRLITDLSYPEEQSVNDAISPALCSVKYITVDQVARHAVLLGKGSLIAKIDIQSAYRLIPVAPEERHYLGMFWRNQMYVDGMLPFGLRSAPKIFTAFADALEWCISTAGVEFIYHYLDDFVVLGRPDTEQCAQSLHTLKSVCNDLGVPLASEKQAGPSTKLEFLGIIIDTVRQELQLPEDKLARLRVLTDRLKSRDSCFKRELESFLGVLNHACSVIPAGRAFLRQVIGLVRDTKKPHHHIRFNHAFRSDLQWWRVFATHWNGKSLMRSACTAEVVLTSDASGSWGCGAWSHSDWFQLAWDATTQHFQIAVKELIPVLIATVVWGSNWKGFSVMVHCDNEAVVTVLNSRYSKDHHLMHMLRTLFFIEAQCQFKIAARHIPGNVNSLADYLSRNELELFYTKHQGANSHPSHIPPNLLQWLLDPHMDWTSELWTLQFNTFVTRE